MYRDGIEIRTEDHINFVLAHGALGDAISSLPAVIWARKNHTFDIGMTAWVAPYQVDLFTHICGGPGLDFMPLDKFNDLVKGGSDKYAGACAVNYAIKDTITRNRHDMAEYAFACLVDRQIDSVEEKCYPHWAPLGERKIECDYAVVPVGATNRASTFQAAVMRPYLEWLLDQKITPVLTGKRGKSGVVMMAAGKPIPLEIHDKVDDLPRDLLAQCIDLRDQTTLMELRDLCGHARVVAGVDGGTLHLAGTTEVPIVYGCTRVDPRHRGIVRNGEQNWNLVHVVPRDLECAGCQSNWTLLFKFDFSKCGYQDFRCTEALHADDFITATDILFKENA